MVSLLSSKASLDSLDELLNRHGDAPPFPKDHRSAPRLVKWLIASSHACRFDDPYRMLNLANMARLAAEACTPTALSSRRKLADMRARAWGQFGTALRVRGLLREAEAALITAERYQAVGTGDLETRGRLLQQTVALHIGQNRFNEAAQATDEASQIFVRLGDFHHYANSLMQKGNRLMNSGEPEEAFVFLKQALPLIDVDNEPEILVTLRFNLVHCYVELGKANEGVALIRKTKEAFARLRYPLLLLRLEWQEGRLLKDLGHWNAAVQNLGRVRRRYLDLGLPGGFVVSSLELADAYLKQGATLDAQRVAQEAIPICRAFEFKYELVALLLLAGKAAERAH
jgi:tetratricopeptide (TPR) repeat protein